MKRRVEHLLLKRNCFTCLHFAHIREYGENPLNIYSRNHCKLKNIELAMEECYKEHDCCLYDPHKVAALDPDFQELETHEQIRKMFEKKYGTPL